jgi:type II secretory pathway component PulK
MDAMIVHNRDRAARAEALARGGVQLAIALVLQDLLDEQEVDARGDVLPGDTLNDPWARIAGQVITTDGGDELRIQILDTGARLNINSIVDATRPEEEPDPQAEEFLTELFDKVIAEVPGPPGEKLYDPRELARALIDFIDGNDVGLGGSSEDDYYQSQDPPYRAANRPLLSVDELRMVEGFDAALVEALRPYVTVFPLVARTGINLNTASPHVLSAVYHGGAIGDGRLASEDTVRRILQVRDENGIVCDEHETDTERCTTTAELMEGQIFPPAASPASAGAFRVLARATVGEMERTVEAVIDRSTPSEPRLLFWRVE